MHVCFLRNALMLILFDHKDNGGDLKKDMVAVVSREQGGRVFYTCNVCLVMQHAYTQGWIGN